MTANVDTCGGEERAADMKLYVTRALQHVFFSSGLEEITRYVRRTGGI